jgi:hypothetical protein
MKVNIYRVSWQNNGSSGYSDFKDQERAQIYNDAINGAGVETLEVDEFEPLPIPTSEILAVTRQRALAEQWPDAFSLIDDIIERGIEAVKLDRNAIKLANPKE